MGAGKRGGGGFAVGSLAGRSALKDLLGFGSSPGTGADATQRDSGGTDSAIIDVQGDGGGSEGKGKGSAVAHLKVTGPAGERESRNVDGGDQLTGLKRRFLVGGIAGQEMEIPERDDAAAVQALHVDRRLE